MLGPSILNGPEVKAVVKLSYIVTVVIVYTLNVAPPTDKRQVVRPLRRCITLSCSESTLLRDRGASSCNTIWGYEAAMLTYSRYVCICNSWI